MSNSLDHLQVYGNQEIYGEMKKNVDFLENKQKLIEKLKALKGGRDRPYAYMMDADYLLLSYINDKEITAAFEALKNE